MSLGNQILVLNHILHIFTKPKLYISYPHVCLYLLLQIPTRSPNLAVESIHNPLMPTRSNRMPMVVPSRRVRPPYRTRASWLTTTSMGAMEVTLAIRLQVAVSTCAKISILSNVMALINSSIHLLN